MYRSVAERRIHMQLELLKYQEELKNDILKKLENTGKAGLELFTSGGKSFIGMSIIEEFVRRHHRKVLWIAPKAALMNVKDKYISKLNCEGYVECFHIECLSVFKDIFNKEQDYAEVGLIIIDEAHKLMARNAYDAYRCEMKKFTNVKIFAMTASSFRNLDGIRSLETLVGEGNIFKFNLGEAIDNNIANPVKYFGTSMNYNKSCFMALDTLEKDYGHVPYIRNIIDRAREKMKGQSSDIEDKVVNFITDKVQFSGEYGDRHIVFFSRIAELEANVNTVKAIMERLYPTGTSVNIIEYYGGLSPAVSERNIREINSAPKPHRVDVILTVDKGAESIHPDNIRSEILFRSTRSMVRFTQMMGRVITLCRQTNQSNYVFDFCNSIRFLGADTILVGRRRVNERVEYNLGTSSLTPEELLSDIKNFKEQSSTASAFEIDIDTNVSELEQIFDRLAVMYDILENLDEIGDTIDENMDKIKFDYNNNIAKFLYHEHEEMYSNYKVIQNALLYGALSDEDRANIGNFADKYGYRVYLTASMSQSDELLVKQIDRYCKKSSSTGYNTESESVHKLRDLKSLAGRLLMDTLNTDVVAFIRIHEGLFEYLKSLFPLLNGRYIKCGTPLKRKVAQELIQSIIDADYDSVNKEEWYKWKAMGAYLRHIEDSGDGGDQGKTYGIAALNYISNLNGGIYRKYQLTEYDKKLGTKAIRLINGTYHKELSLVSEHFLYELLDGKHRDNVYVMGIFDVVNFNNKLKRDALLYTSASKKADEFYRDSTEDKLVETIRYYNQCMYPNDIMFGLLSSKRARSIFKDVGKNGNTKLAKYCINRLYSKDKLMIQTVKRAAINGLGYTKIVCLAFPDDAHNMVRKTINDIENGTDTEDVIGMNLRLLKNKYCMGMVATLDVLSSIDELVIPKIGCGAIKKFIAKLKEA